jgi:tetratricopeptide (TPR) repeat protein
MSHADRRGRSLFTNIGRCIMVRLAMTVNTTATQFIRELAFLSSMLSGLFKSLLRAPFQEGRARRAKELFETGLAQKDSGDTASARRSFEKSLALDPDHADAHYWLGVLLTREKSYSEAARHVESALALNPAIEGGWIDLGSIHYLQRNLARAGASFRAAIAAEPSSVLAHGNLGIVLKESGHRTEALEHLRRAYELAPEGAGTLRNLVVTLVEFDRCEDALAVAKEAAAREPGGYQAQLMLGYAYQKIHEPLRALACYEAVYRMRTDDAELYYNRGIALQDVGRLPEACSDYERALALEAEYPLAAFHWGLARLLLGDFERGWDDYEERRLSTDFPGRSSSLPQWDGSPLANRTVLVCGEQGLGDEIMFASVLPQVIDAAGHVVLECEPRLLKLFSRSFPAATVYAASPDRRSQPSAGGHPIDVEAYGGSLPRFFRRKLEDFPRHHGYLKADPARVEHWRRRLAALGPGLKAGISWSGGVRKTRQPLRSVPLERLAPILRVPGIRPVSLQYTAGAAEEAAAFGGNGNQGVKIEHWQEAIDDYDETAALVCALDLVISVCTSVIHLTGALGRPAWVMAPYSPEWRYGFSGSTMPWYPSVKIVRQPAFGEWDPVISTVASDLQQLSGTVG